MNISQRWKQSTITNQLNVILAAVICLMTFFNIAFFVKQVLDQDRQVGEIKAAITDGIGQAKTAIDASLAHNSNALDKALRDNKDALTTALQQMHTDAQTTLDASIEQSKAALEVTIANARNDQRAWVGPIDTVGPQFKDANGQPIYFAEGQRASLGVVIANSGKTPARRVEHRFSYRTLPNGTPFTPRYPQPPRQAGVIQPGARPQLVIATETAPTAQNIQTYRSGSQILYLFGHVTYEDIYGKPHYTTFCMYLLADLSAFGDCDTYNDAN